MKLTLTRHALTRRSTIGTLNCEDKFYGYTLEDRVRAVKVKHYTAIPAGEYTIRFMPRSSPKTLTYRNKFDWFTKHLEIRNIDNFKSVYIHIGNTSSDTSGCVLIGEAAAKNRIKRSTRAFKPFYLAVSKALNNGEEVTITIKNK